MEIHNRKHNRIIDYDYCQNGAYFVTICTQDRKQILSEIVGDGSPVPKPAGKLAEDLIQEISIKYPCVAVNNYVIMPDHIHILLQIDDSEGTGNPSPTLGNIIGWYKYQLTKDTNLLFGTQGNRILQRSYYDHVIRDQRDYDEIWQYIDNNPQKWLLEHGHIE